MERSVAFTGEEMEALRAVLSGKENPLDGKKLQRFEEKIKSGVQL
jgi:thymidylate synthase (FAD)